MKIKQVTINLPQVNSTCSIAKWIFSFCSLLCVFLIISCAEKPESKKVLIGIGCDSQEAISDIEYSVAQLEKYFAENNIVIVTKKITDKCGYRLIQGDRVKDINGALTDVDLRKECMQFFRKETH